MTVATPISASRCSLSTHSPQRILVRLPQVRLHSLRVAAAPAPALGPAGQQGGIALQIGTPHLHRERMER